MNSWHSTVSRRYPFFFQRFFKSDKSGFLPGDPSRCASFQGRSVHAGRTGLKRKECGYEEKTISRLSGFEGWAHDSAYSLHRQRRRIMVCRGPGKAECTGRLAVCYGELQIIGIILQDQSFGKIQPIQ
jgi:hypothetical protein